MNSIEFNSLDDILHNTIFAIPDYQRGYSWSNAEVSTLLEDIERLYFDNGDEGSEREHFCGAIVTIPFDPEVSRNTKDAMSLRGIKNFEKVNVIDGQQRLSTLSLLLIAIRDYAKERALDTGDINRLIETGKTYPDETRIPVIHFADVASQKCYADLLADKQPNPCQRSPLSVKKMIASYNACREKVAAILDNSTSTQDAIDLLIEQIQYHLTFVGIFCREEVDAYQIFESLNSTGLSLSPAEQLKNLLLMRSHKRDETLSGWESIIDMVGERDIVEFLAHYLFFKKHKRISKKDIYVDFKKMLDNQTVSTLLEDLKTCAGAYRDIRHPSADCPASNILLDLSDLGVKQAYVPLLAGGIRFGTKSKEFSRFADSVLVFIARHLVCDQSSNKLDAVFGEACRLLVDESQTVEDAVRYFKHSQMTDSDFRHHFAQLSFDYSAKPQRIAKTLLRRIEEHSHGHQRPFHIDRNDLTVEHIIPKQPTKEDLASWLGPESEKLTDDSLEEFINTYAKSIGNLALLFRSENASAGNSSYQSKLSLYTQDIVDKKGNNRGIPTKHFVLLEELVAMYPDSFDAAAVSGRAQYLGGKAIMAWS